MESKSTSGALRPLVHGYPYTTGSGSGKEEMKEEVVGLGVELSLSVAELMFLLCDDICTMLCFCRRLLRYTMPADDPVLQRLLLVFHSVQTKYIEPKKEGNQDDSNNLANWELIRTTWKYFTEGVIVLHRLVFILRRKDSNSFDDRLLSSAIAKYKQQVLEKIGEKLRGAKDVSEANGFPRESIKSNISEFWQSLFDEEAGEAITEATMNEIVSKLFPPVALSKSLHREIESLTIYSPYILGTDFAKEGLKEEAVQIGAELSLYVAESMFLLCDDTRSVLRFCLMLWRNSMNDLKPATLVVYKLLHAIHYVYSKHIKPKKIAYKTGGKSVQWALILSTLCNFYAGIRDLNTLVSQLTIHGNWSDGRDCTSRLEQVLKKVDEKLSCVKDISKANGFARDDGAMKSDILELWKSLFDKETEEPWAQKVIRDEMLSELFLHLSKGGAP